ncbi:MAG TPA: cation-translocating P-type ATPase [Acidimicrobiales bacterium]|nr:cation-translocating P-type ATPase [Acidimicrobiales bacterium]
MARDDPDRRAAGSGVRVGTATGAGTGLLEGEAAPEEEPGADAVVELTVGGMHCNACATRIERALAGHGGVRSASVNLATARAFVSFDPDATSAEDLCAVVGSTGYSATPRADEGATAAGSDPDHWQRRALVSWPLALAALAVALAAPETAGPGWAVLALGVTVEVAGGWPFLRATVRQLRHGATSMDTLVTVGTLAALAVIAVETIALGGRHVHLGGSGAFAARLHGVMAPLIVAIVVTGRAVEARARRRAADALHALLALRPPTARLVADTEDEEGRLVAPESVPVGALVRVRPAEALPLDGTVVAGWSAVDESMLTGEPMPVDRGPGDSVTGGTTNGGGVLVVEVGSVAAESVLARLQRLVEEAQRDKPPLQRLADRISSVFVPAVLAGAVATFLLWWLVDGNFGTAVLAGVAVVLVACPCAMGLAAPVAVMVGTGQAAAMGILVRNSDALERLARADTAVFDKTGTLTERAAVVTAVAAAPGTSETEVLRLAAAVEADTDHPLAVAIRQAAPPVAAAADAEVVPGVGVRGTVEGRHVRVGRVGDDELPPVLETARAAWSGGDTVVAVRRDDAVVGLVALATPLRPEAPAALERLRAMGLGTAVLSGDAAPAVERVAAALHIDDARSGLTPAQKLEVLRELEAEGRRVLMVGDGVNDAPALAAADVGCAVGSGSEAAVASSDVALLGSDLNGVPAAVAVARSTSAVIVQNFGWAMGYNVSALPLAAAGLLDPLVAAVTMGVSSLVVVLNSLRLLRLGRSGTERVRGPALSPRRAFASSVAVPVVLFATATFVGQAVSPSRGQPLLPTLPSITTEALPHGAGAEVYLGSSSAGANQFHLLFTGAGPGAAVRLVTPVVQAARRGGPDATLRLVYYAPEHYIAYRVFDAGTWHFTVHCSVDGVARSVTFTRTLS